MFAAHSVAAMTDGTIVVVHWAASLIIAALRTRKKRHNQYTHS
jgi:hypothetical protein